MPPIITITPTAEADLGGVRALLDEAFDGRFSDHDWNHALGGWHAVVRDGGAAIAHAAVVPRCLEVAGRAFGAGYLEAVATAPARQGEGHGAAAVRAVGEVLVARFQLGALSTGEHAFYERLGWERWRGPASVRDGELVRRTPDEDDGIMVLRFGPSAGIDLDAPITCEARPGDDW